MGSRKQSLENRVLGLSKYLLLFGLVSSATFASRSFSSETSADSLLNLAFHYYFTKKYRFSHQYFDKFLEFYGDHEVALRFLGKIRYNQKDIAGALTYLYRAHKADPGSKSTLLLLAAINQSRNEIDSAIRAYGKILSIDPFHEISLASVARIYESKRNNRKAIAYYKKLVIAVRKSGYYSGYLNRAYISLGNYYSSQGNYKKAIYYYLRLRTLQPDKIEILAVLGELYKMTGQFDKAISVLNDLLKLKKHHLPAEDSLVECYFILDQRKANSLLLSLRKRYKKLSLLNQAIFYSIHQEHRLAKYHFKKVLKKNPSRLSAHIGLVQAYAKEKNYDQLRKEAFSVVILAQKIGAFSVAQRYYSDVDLALRQASSMRNFRKKFFIRKPVTPLLLDSEVENLAFDHFEALSTHGTTLEALGYYKAAIVYYQHALRHLNQIKIWYKDQDEQLKTIDSDEFKNKAKLLEKKMNLVNSREYKTLLTLGWLLQEKPLKKFKDALKLQEIAKAISPKKPQAEFLTGIILFNMGESETSNYSKAVGHLRNAIRLYSEVGDRNKIPSSYYFYLGMALEKNDDFDTAEHKLKKAIELAPYNPTYLNFLGYMYSLRNIKLSDANNLLIRALEDDPENEAYLDSLGWILFKKGQYKRALEQLLLAANESEKKKKTDSVIYFHLAETYYLLNHFSLSHFYYSKTLKYSQFASEKLDTDYIQKQINKIENR